MESWEGSVLSEGLSCRRSKTSGVGELLQAVTTDHLSEALVLSVGEGLMSGHLGTLESMFRQGARCWRHRTSREVAAPWEFYTRRYL